MKLRNYQEKLKKDIYASWSQGNKNVLAVLPCRGGKTVIFSKIIAEHKGASCAIAHTHEITSQISISLAREGIKHKIIGSQQLIKDIVSLHMMQLGKSYYDPMSQCAVASVDTIIRRTSQLDNWCKQVSLWIQDECHHVLKSNKWGRAVSMFPNSKGLGVTATPLRLDGKGLGAHNHGVFNDMVYGPSMSELIRMGYLCDYIIYSPDSRINLNNVPISKKTKEYAPKALKSEVIKSKIVGDVVDKYKLHANGKLGITFAVDIEECHKISQQYNDNGVPSEVLCSKTPIIERAKIIERFKNRDILQIVNVNILGEGIDIPNVEVVSIARPSKSLNKHIQTMCRCLTISPDKLKGIIIDHVNAARTLGLPEGHNFWSLESCQTTRRDQGILTIHICPGCTCAFKRISVKCPNCGYIIRSENRTRPEFVDGDLTQLDKSAILLLMNKIKEIDITADAYRAKLIDNHCPIIGQNRNVNIHLKNQGAQALLRQWIKYWSGWMRLNKYTDSEIYRAFYLTFSIDVLTAMTLKSKNADILTRKIINDI